MAIKKPHIVFDVNETLLDLEHVSPIFSRIFGDPGAMRLWFADLVLYSEALTLAGIYVPFTEIGAAVLQMHASARGVRLNESAKRDLGDAFASMPAHSDVADGLRRLRAAGFRLFTLTNNLLEVQKQQLERAGIDANFEKMFTVDGVKRFKPAREVYTQVESELGVAPQDLLLVACHTWDTIGAVAAGWSGALVKRAGNDLLSVGPQPQFVATDLNDLADQLVDRYSSTQIEE